MALNLILPILIFGSTFFLIFNERVNKTEAALLGGTLLVVLGILEYQEAIGFIDFKVLGLILGMMILVEAMRESGVLQFIAIKGLQLARGDPKKLLVFFSLLTVFFSSLLSNIPAITIIAPITIFICEYIEYNPLPYVISEAIMANVAGLLTLISSVPNIMIGVEANLSFIDFMINSGIFGSLLIIPTILVLYYLFGDEIRDMETCDLEEIDASRFIEDKGNFIAFSILFASTLFLFLISEFIPMEPELIAIAAGVFGLLISKEKTEEVIERIDWPLVLFFAGLYITIGGLEVCGALDKFAEISANFLTPLSVLWFSSLASAVVDNVPITAVMIPIIKQVAVKDIFWWALVLGVNLGGNITPIGSPSTVVALNILGDKQEVSFMDYLRWGGAISLLQIGLASVYLLLLSMF